MAAPFQPADISRLFAERIPIHFARRHTLVGLNDNDDRFIRVATDDADKQRIVDNLAVTLDCAVRLEVHDAAAIQAAINTAYEEQSVDVAGAIHRIDVENGSEQAVQVEGDLLDNATCAPVIRLVNLVLFEAARRRASDVHVHPHDGHVMLRLRIDGVLIDYQQVPGTLRDELTSRIKVMAGMDIAEKRLPQDGRSTVRIGERLIDLRVASIPTAHGERIVLRLLDKGARRYDLTELGMPDDTRRRFEQLIQRSHGMILMTGPTGAGKSTTLYAALQCIDYQRLNVVTLEDPIEYQLVGISQTQVSNRKGMTFAAGLRSLLRQDPDVIMVGEIRDEETARLAIQSALTGHLVISTLHTNDAAGALTRLLDLGIEPYLVADSLLGVGAQRLVRTNCSACSHVARFEQADLAELGLEPGRDGYHAGGGCEQCDGLGFRGRVGLFELLVIDDAIQALIHQQAALNAIRNAARQQGMRTLREEGVRLVQAGATTPAEVLRVTQRGELVEEVA